MSWQSETFDRLRAGDWVLLADLFAPVESQIEMHRAMRRVSAQRRTSTPEDVVGVSEARWMHFTSVVNNMYVECDPPRTIKTRFKPGSRVRLLSRGPCPVCQGPMYRPTWTTVTKIQCPKCDLMMPTGSRDRGRPLAPPPTNGDARPRPSGDYCYSSPHTVGVCRAIIEAADAGRGLILPPADIQILSRHGSIAQRAMDEGYVPPVRVARTS